mmetsp:Transcript_13881/g.37266  ORF Transcript_13881/g.37266 Transcript_13881/m.37266 type:complete len:264 (+) Transcript_13881:887-1678(+)
MASEAAIQSPSSMAFSCCASLSSRRRSRRWNSTTSASLAGPISSVAMLTAVRMQKRWMRACPAMDTKMAGWKRRRRGRSGCMRSTGVAYEKATLAIMRSHDDAIIWRSDERAPSSDRADRTYALMRLSSIMICCCCRAERSVQRPWRMRSTMLRTDGLRLVKGAATLASPGRTIGLSVSAAISDVSLDKASFWASYTFPWMACKRLRSSSSSLRMRLVVFLMISTCPKTPLSRPWAVRRSSSSEIHCACLDWSSRCLAWSAWR